MVEDLSYDLLVVVGPKCMGNKVLLRVLPQVLLDLSIRGVVTLLLSVRGLKHDMCVSPTTGGEVCPLLLRRELTCFDPCLALVLFVQQLKCLGDIFLGCIAGVNSLEFNCHGVAPFWCYWAVVMLRSLIKEFINGFLDDVKVEHVYGDCVSVPGIPDRSPPAVSLVEIDQDQFQRLFGSVFVHDLDQAGNLVKKVVAQFDDLRLVGNQVCIQRDGVQQE